MNSLFYQIGNERLTAILDHFYDQVFEHPVIGKLFNGDKSLIKEKQRKFLTQFLGGPQLYSEEYGHPKMRLRHLPHAIDTEARDAWLKCMHEAIFTILKDEQELAKQLYDCFPPVANHMVNR